MFEIAVLVVVIFFLLALIIGAIFLIQGAPFVRTDDQTANEIVTLVKKYKGKRVIDLGSGDGKLVIALAEAGIDAYGIEINPLLYLRSKRAVKSFHLQNNAHIFWGSFWNTDLSKYDIVVIYGIKHIMRRLGEKLEKELPPGAHILTNFFVFPQWKPETNYERVVVYKINGQ